MRRARIAVLAANVTAAAVVSTILLTTSLSSPGLGRTRSLGAIPSTAFVASVAVPVALVHGFGTRAAARATVALVHGPVTTPAGARDTGGHVRPTPRLDLRAPRFPR
jgi:hypothetical protein